MFFEDSEKHGISISSGVRIVFCPWWSWQAIQHRRPFVIRGVIFQATNRCRSYVWRYVWLITLTVCNTQCHSHYLRSYHSIPPLSRVFCMSWEKRTLIYLKTSLRLFWRTCGGIVWRRVWECCGDPCHSVLWWARSRAPDRTWDK